MALQLDPAISYLELRPPEGRGATAGWLCRGLGSAECASAYALVDGPLDADPPGLPSYVVRREKALLRLTALEFRGLLQPIDSREKAILVGTSYGLWLNCRGFHPATMARRDESWLLRAYTIGGAEEVLVQISRTGDLAVQRRRLASIPR